jgi:hypothetical protein
MPKEDPDGSQSSFVIVLAASTLRHLLPRQLASQFPLGAIIDEELERPDLQQRLQVTCAAFFLAQLLNQRGREPPGSQMFAELSAQAVGTERLAAHGLNHEQIHALQELEASARAARDPLGPERPQPKRGARQLHKSKRTRYDDCPGGKTPGPGCNAPSEPTGPIAGRQAPTAEPTAERDTTLRPLLPESLADRLPPGGIADEPLQCLEAPLRTQLMFAQWVALHLLNKTSQPQGVLHNSLWDAIEWCYSEDIFDDVHRRVFRHINSLGNAAEHLPTLEHGLGQDQGHRRGQVRLVLRELAAQ